MQKPKRLKEIVAHNLKSRREALGMSQAEVARRAKVTPRYISILESRPKNLTLETLESVCESLKISVCDLLCDPAATTKSRKAALEAALEIIKHELLSLK